MKTILLYTKNHCPYCVAAKRLLESNNFNYQEINIETADNPDEQRTAMLKSAKGKTFPQIIIDGKGIGGYTDLVSYFEEQTNQ